MSSISAVAVLIFEECTGSEPLRCLAFIECLRQARQCLALYAYQFK